MDRLPEAKWDAVLAALDRWGLLVAQDAKIVSVTTLVAGEPVSGSWWPHPANGEIYDCFGRLDRVTRTFSARLLDGKWVYVHERLVPSVHAVAVPGEPWQEGGLSRDAAQLLRRIRAEGEIRTDAAPDAGGRRALAKAATDLECRLLAESRQVHTAEGHHTRFVTAWAVPPRLGLPPVADARSRLEEAVAALNEAHGTAVKLPWQRPASPRRRGRRG